MLVTLPADARYLAGDMISVAMALALFLAYPGERRAMVLGALLLLPMGMIQAPISEGAYWAPGRILGGSFGIEDILFTSAFAAIGWGLARMAAGPMPPLAPLDGEFFLRCLGLGLLGGAVFFGLLALGAYYGPAALISQGVVGALVLSLRRDLVPLALRSSGLFTLYYFCGLSAMVLIAGPGFASMWLPEYSLGPAIWGIPVEEYLFATAFGATWVPMLLFAARAPAPAPPA